MKVGSKLGDVENKVRIIKRKHGIERRFDAYLDVANRSESTFGGKPVQFPRPRRRLADLLFAARLTVALS